MSVVAIAWLAVAALAGATVWAVSFRPDSPADFTFINMTEIQSVDPAIVSGQVEGRTIEAIFEGLTSWDPKTLAPLPGVAERWEISPDGRIYTFHLRADAKHAGSRSIDAWPWMMQHRRRRQNLCRRLNSGRDPGQMLMLRFVG